MARVTYQTDPSIPPPRPITVTFTFHDDECPVRTVVLEIERGQINAVSLRKRSPVLSQDLRLPWTLMMEALREGPPGTVQAAGHRGPPRRFTDEFLTAVADAYRTTGSIAGITREVDERFAASEAAKYRWIRAARERGLLEQRER